MQVSFVGSQGGLSIVQRQKLPGLLRGLGPTAVHHADMIGADEELDEVARSLYLPTIAHLPEEEEARAYLFADVYRDPQPYGARYRALIDQTDLLILCPAESTEQANSFVWAARRYAIKVGKQVKVLQP